MLRGRLRNFAHSVLRHESNTMISRKFIVGDRRGNVLRVDHDACIYTQDGDDQLAPMTQDKARPSKRRSAEDTLLRTTQSMMT